MSEPTVFDKIIRGEIPSYKIYEDDHVFAFLDIGPVSHGHALVVPKESKAHLHELSEASSAAIGRVLPRICRAVTKASGAPAYNVLQNNGAPAGQAVFHVHFHIIPRFDGDGFGLVWKPGELSKETALELVEKIQAAMTESP